MDMKTCTLCDKEIESLLKKYIPNFKINNANNRTDKELGKISPAVCKPRGAKTTLAFWLEMGPTVGHSTHSKHSCTTFCTGGQSRFSIY